MGMFGVMMLGFLAMALGSVGRKKYELDPNRPGADITLPPALPIVDRVIDLGPSVVIAPSEPTIPWTDPGTTVVLPSVTLGAMK